MEESKCGKCGIQMFTNGTADLTLCRKCNQEMFKESENE